MTELQKLIECWRPIAEFVYDSHEPLNNTVLIKVLLGYEDAEQVTTATFIPSNTHPIDGGFAKEGWYEQQVDINYECDKCGYSTINPTHYMPLDTPEKLAKIVGVLASQLERMRNENSDPYGIAKHALQQAEKIAGDL